MKNYKRKIAVAGLTLALLVGGQASIFTMPVQAASYASVSDQQQFQKDMQSLTKQNRHDYLYVLRAQGPMGESLSEGIVSYKLSPNLTVKDNMKTRTNGNTSHMQFYTQETKKGLVNYVQSNESGWTRNETNAPVDLSLLKNNLPKTLGGQILSSAKNVQLLSSQNNQNSYKVVVDGGRFLKAVPQFKEQAFGAKTDEMMKILDRLGDVTLFVVVDTDSHQLTALKADLSQPIQNAVAAAADSGDINAVQAAAMKAMAGSLQVQLEVSSIDANTIGSIDVPDRVVKNARG